MGPRKHTFSSRPSWTVGGIRTQETVTLHSGPTLPNRGQTLQTWDACLTTRLSHLGPGCSLAKVKDRCSGPDPWG